MQVVNAAISIVPKIDDPPSRHEEESLKQMERVGAGGVNCCAYCHSLHAQLVDVSHDLIRSEAILKGKKKMKLVNTSPSNQNIKIQTTSSSPGQ